MLTQLVSSVDNLAMTITRSLGTMIGVVSYIGRETESESLLLVMSLPVSFGFGLFGVDTRLVLGSVALSEITLSLLPLPLLLLLLLVSAADSAEKELKLQPDWTRASSWTRSRWRLMRMMARMISAAAPIR